MGVKDTRASHGNNGFERSSKAHPTSDKSFQTALLFVLCIGLPPVFTYESLARSLDEALQGGEGEG